MPGKTQKRRAKFKRRSHPELSGSGNSVSQVQVLPIQLKKEAVVEMSKTAEGQIDRLRQVPQELRRIAITGGVALAVLIALYLLLS